MNHTIGIIGNPNCGKTTLFNELTGTRQRTGNWPGVTVEKKTGVIQLGKDSLQVVDLPGIYSLSATSLDEKVAQDFILSKQADLIVNILDASNLERNLYLTMQLIELQVPLVLACNMADLARDKGIEIDFVLMSQTLGCPVLPLVAYSGEGVSELKNQIRSSLEHPQMPINLIHYPELLEQGIQELIVDHQKHSENPLPSPHWSMLKLLEGESAVVRSVPELTRLMADDMRNRFEEELDEDLDIVVADHRFGAIREVVQKAVKKKREVSANFSDRLDKVVLNRLLGIPIFLLAMYLTFMVTINIGGAFIDFFDQFTGTIVVDGFSVLLSSLGSPEWLIALLAGGIGGGIQTVATFIPPIFFMFLCLSILEDSGYMARAAFVMDRVMRFIGLPGKSVVSMMVGFGCSVPAVMSTRTLENERDRILTVMMAPFMSCGARLPVYALFAAAFFPTQGQNVVFGLYLIGIFMAMLTGLLLKNTLLKGKSAPFIMELPPYHLPSVKGVLLHTWDRLRAFIMRAGKVIIGVVIVLSMLNSMGTDGSFGHEDTDKSVLSLIGRSITPIFTPMGIEEDNWPATVGIFTGIFAKEAIVGTLDSIYAAMDAQLAEELGQESAFDFWDGITGAFATIPAGLLGVPDTLTDPLGVRVGDLSKASTAASELEVAQSTFGSMILRFNGAVGAFTYLLFVLLYFPCVAAIAAVYRETSMGWAVFSGTYMTVVAWMVATVFYQANQLTQAPSEAISWLVGIAITVLLGITGLAIYAKKQDAAAMVASKATARLEKQGI